MSAPLGTTVASLQVFLERLVDYAGLFAPASLDMSASVNNYSRYLTDPRRWALGRFVLPIARRDEFLNAQKIVATDRWQLSGIVSQDIRAELAAVEEFNRKASGAVIDSVELRVCKPEEVDLVSKNTLPGVAMLFEFAPGRADEFLRILRRIGGCAKLRTGGVAEDAFPSVEQIAGFIAQCAEAGVPFKATAGLHHPLRCLHPLTYEPNSPSGMMHGFLNLFTAAAIAWSAVRSGGKVSRATLATCLADGERANWHFGDDTLTWSGEKAPMQFNVEGLRSMRSKFALSFGSCSFDEPFQDMHELDLL